MEEIIKSTIITGVTLFVLGYLSKFARLEAPKDKLGRTQLRMPKFYLYFGYFSVLVGVIILGAFLFEEEAQDTSTIVLLIIVFLQMAGAGIGCMVSYKKHVAYFDEDQIQSTRIFGQTEQVKWKELRKISFSPLSSMIKLEDENGRVVMLHQHLVGVKAVLDRVKTLKLKVGRVKIPHYN